jgi:hypothetical protein
VGIGRDTTATNVLLLAPCLDHDRILHRSCQTTRSIAKLANAAAVKHKPFRDASIGLMSKMSIPSILPRISNRSRPVD